MSHMPVPGQLHKISWTDTEKRVFLCYFYAAPEQLLACLGRGVRCGAIFLGVKCSLETSKHHPAGGRQDNHTHQYREHQEIAPAPSDREFPKANRCRNDEG